MQPTKQDWDALIERLDKIGEQIELLKADISVFYGPKVDAVEIPARWYIEREDDHPLWGDFAEWFVNRCVYDIINYKWIYFAYDNNGLNPYRNKEYLQNNAIHITLEFWAKHIK
jgi:hypothetical protein